MVAGCGGVLVLLASGWSLGVAAVYSPYPVSLSVAASLLDVPLPSPRTAVRAAYRRKAAVSHPDVCKLPSANADFVRMTAAYELLLQFGMSTAAATAARPSTASGGSTAERSARRSGGSSSRSSYERAASTPGATWSAARAQHRDPERMQRRVEAWRKYWQLSLLANHVASQARAKQEQLRALTDEVQLLQRRLGEAVACMADVQSVRLLRTRCDQASAQLADVQCAVKAFEARAATLLEQAKRQEQAAQCVA